MTFDSDDLFTTFGKKGIKSSIDLFHELKCVSPLQLELNLTLRELNMFGFTVACTGRRQN